ncbi:MAG: hypothetical protein DRJ10_17995 [Bacteroidetes bacterium]|nr:MAG: hypothetical protein DRJ10_17995 [Bacteroidota bacterium]
MRKYFIKGFYFCIPFLIIFIFIFFVDPYEFINVSHFINSDDKIDVYKRSDESSPRGTMLWKVLHYRRKPVANVLIGDSQGTNIDEDLIKAESGKDVFNFCIPGSSYNTMFETFWFVNDQCKLENVYMQLGFMNYNAKRPYSLFHFAQDYIDNPFLYFTTKEILFDSFYNTYYQIDKDSDFIHGSYEYDSFEKLDELSTYRLKLFFEPYSYPTEYINELKKITDYCMVNDINLKFIILPTYKGVQEYLETNDLISMRDKFREDIKSLGYVYDFNQPGDITKQRKNFKDYFHPHNHVLDEVTRKIWSQ